MEGRKKESRVSMPSNALALSRLLIAERPRIVRLIATVVSGNRDAEDVAQTLWERVQGVKDHPPIVNHRAYLFRLAFNQALRYRKQTLRHEDVLAQAQLLLECKSDDFSPEHISIDREDVRKVEQAIKNLPPEIWKVLVLNRFEGVTQPEIAQRLGISVATVERYIRRALDCIAEARSDTE